MFHGKVFEPKNRINGHSSYVRGHNSCNDTDAVKVNQSWIYSFGNKLFDKSVDKGKINSCDYSLQSSEDEETGDSSYLQAPCKDNSQDTANN